MQSYVCGILDPYGGIRFIVDQDKTFRNHVRIDEICFVMPWQTEEPVPWKKIPWLVAKVEHDIAEWIRTRNDPDVLEQLPIKMYRIRCAENTLYKRAINTEHIVMG